MILPNRLTRLAKEWAAFRMRFHEVLTLSIDRFAATTQQSYLYQMYLASAHVLFIDSWAWLPSICFFSRVRELWRCSEAPMSTYNAEYETYSARSTKHMRFCVLCGVFVTCDISGFGSPSGCGWSQATRTLLSAAAAWMTKKDVPFRSSRLSELQGADVPMMTGKFCQRHA